MTIKTFEISAFLKSDIITALTVTGLNGDAGLQISMTRLTSLITARYNWRADLLTIGQKEMAHLWGLGERTVKREIKRWLETGLLICLRPGVRGRVATYRLNRHRLCELTEPIWDKVGTDFADRMAQLRPDTAQVIRLAPRNAASSQDELSGGQGGWAAVSTRLAHRFPAQHDAWIAPLIAREEQGQLVLEARSAFAAEYIKTHFGRDICEAVEAEWGRRIPVVIQSVDLRNSL